MIKVLVGSKNPVKIEATKEAFSRYFGDVKVVGISVDSKVSKQPIEEETFQGAKNRALELRALDKKDGLKSDFFVGIEGGIGKMFSKWFSFGSMCVVDKNGRVGFGTSSHFELPDHIVEELLNGKELGEISDRLTREKNAKQKGGAIGFLTRGLIDRKNLYLPGLIMALVPFVNEDLYFNYQTSDK